MTLIADHRLIQLHPLWRKLEEPLEKEGKQLLSDLTEFNQQRENCDSCLQKLDQRCRSWEEKRVTFLRDSVLRRPKRDAALMLIIETSLLSLFPAEELKLKSAIPPLCAADRLRLADFLILEEHLSIAAKKLVSDDDSSELYDPACGLLRNYGVVVNALCEVDRVWGEQGSLTQAIREAMGVRLSPLQAKKELAMVQPVIYRDQRKEA